jgi:hypothetical protein
VSEILTEAREILDHAQAEYERAVRRLHAARNRFNAVQAATRRKEVDDGDAQLRQRLEAARRAKGPF